MMMVIEMGIRNNPKQLQGYYRKGYLIKWNPIREVEGVMIDGYYSTTPEMFRYKHFNGQGLKKEDSQYLQGWLTNSSNVVIETRFNLNFNTNDLVLFSLEVNSEEDENGLKFANYGRVSKHEQYYELNESPNAYRKRVDSVDIRNVLYVG